MTSAYQEQTAQMREGAIAWCRGFARTDNPYQPGTMWFDDWKYGWETEAHL